MRMEGLVKIICLSLCIINTVGYQGMEQQKPLDNKKPYKVEVSFDSSEESYKHATGRVMLYTYETHPIFTIEANKAVQDKLNTFYQQEKKKEYEEKGNRLLQEVTQQWQDAVSDEGLNYVSSFSLNVSYKLERAD